MWKLVVAFMVWIFKWQFQRLKPSAPMWEKTSCHVLLLLPRNRRKTNFIWNDYFIKQHRILFKNVSMVSRKLPRNFQFLAKVRVARATLSSASSRSCVTHWSREKTERRTKAPAHSTSPCFAWGVWKAHCEVVSACSRIVIHYQKVLWKRNSN